MAAVGEVVVREANALTSPLMDALPHDGLLCNLMLSCSIYSDVGRMVAADEFGEDRLLREKTAAKYRDSGIPASSDIQMVLAVAREARNRVARQARARRRGWQNADAHGSPAEFRRAEFGL